MCVSPPLHAREISDSKRPDSAAIKGEQKDEAGVSQLEEPGRAGYTDFRTCLAVAVNEAPVGGLRCGSCRDSTRGLSESRMASSHTLVTHVRRSKVGPGHATPRSLLSMVVTEEAVSSMRHCTLQGFDGHEKVRSADWSLDVARGEEVARFTTERLEISARPTDRDPP